MKAGITFGTADVYNRRHSRVGGNPLAMGLRVKPAMTARVAIRPYGFLRLSCPHINLVRMVSKNG